MSEQIGTLWLYKNRWNFESTPTHDDYIFYGQALLVCAKGDGVLDDAERKWVLGYMAAFGCPQEVREMLSEYHADDTISDVLSKVTHVTLEATGSAVVYDAVAACWADGELSDGEIAKIKEMGAQMKVSAEKVDQLIANYAEEQANRQRRLELVGFADPENRAY